MGTTSDQGAVIFRKVVRTDGTNDLRHAGWSLVLAVRGPVIGDVAGAGFDVVNVGLKIAIRQGRC